MNLRNLGDQVKEKRETSSESHETLVVSVTLACMELLRVIRQFGRKLVYKALAKRTRKSELAFRLATYLRGLALTLVELKFGRKFFTIWPPSASRHKLICYKNARTNDGFLRLANPFGHPSQVRTQVLVLQTCVDLCRPASPFGQGLKHFTAPTGQHIFSWNSVFPQERYVHLPASTYQYQHLFKTFYPSS